MAKVSRSKREKDAGLVRVMALLEMEVLERFRYYMAARGAGTKTYRGLNEVLAAVLPEIPDDAVKLKRLPVANENVEVSLD